MARPETRRGGKLPAFWFVAVAVREINNVAKVSQSVTTQYLCEIGASCNEAYDTF
jgi:hypothetical protein